MFIDIYQIDADNCDILSELYRYTWNKLYDGYPPDWVNEYKLLVLPSKNIHTVMVLTRRKNSLDINDLVALAEIYSNEKTVEIWNLLSKNNQPVNSKTLLDAIINYYKSQYFWIAISDIDYPQLYENAYFDEIECLEVSPLTHTPVSNRRQYILNKSSHPSSQNEYYGLVKAIKLCSKGFYILRTIDDGSCFFHGILYSIHSNYHNLDHKEQLKAVAQFRKSLAGKITPELFKKLGGGQLSILASEIYAANHNIPLDHPDIFKTVHKNYINKIADTRKWAGEENIDLLYHIFKIGILILTPDANNNPSIYPVPIPDNYYNTVKSFVVLWYESDHYNVVIESREKRCFDRNDDIVNYFKTHSHINV